MKRRLIFGAVVLLTIVLLGGYYVYNDMFPKAGPIPYPDAGMIDEVTITMGEQTMPTYGEEADLVLEFIRHGKPTRRMSVNDHPYVSVWYQIRIETPERNYVYYLYQEDGKTWIELPYEGIYEVAPEFLNYVSNMF